MDTPTYTRPTTWAQFVQHMTATAEQIDAINTQLRRDVRDIYRLLGMPLPASLREKE